MKARIYEIKQDAIADAQELRDEKKDRFFWNDIWFKDYEIGDRVFIVNKWSGWAMYTTIGDKVVPANRSNNGHVQFAYDGTTYSVQDPKDQYKNFIRFDIIQEVPFNAYDKWTSLGRSEVSDLWLGDRAPESSHHRITRLHQLRQVFRDGEGAKALDEIGALLGDSQQMLRGVAVVDGENWFEEAAKEIGHSGRMVVWWTRKPVGLEMTEAALDITLQRHKWFGLYYTRERRARFRARVIDWATQENYPSKRWNEDGTVVGYAEKFSDYRDQRNGKDHIAKVAFLVDRFEPVVPEIPIERFNFMNGPAGLTQANMVPYFSIVNEPEWGVGADLSTDIQMRFLEYLEGIVQESTASQYVAYMKKVGQWLITEGVVEPSFDIWLNTDQIKVIDRLLSTEYREKWQSLNREKKNWYSATWNHWVKFNQQGMTSETVGSHTEVASIAFNDPLRAILMAIKTKPFVLMAGISGTGKSRLVRSLAYLTCPPELQGDRPGNFCLLMVKPNWHDPTELLGYVSRISGSPQYVLTEFIRFLVKAWEHPEIPFFLCLDEMNLAPVEQYFADYLSAVETRRLDGTGTVVVDPVLTAENAGGMNVFEDALERLGLNPHDGRWDRFIRDGICLPANLVVMGTVNMDETTHSFSRKVLDRAMTFEMNEVDLRGGLEREEQAWRYPEQILSGDQLMGRITRGGDVPATTNGYVKVLEHLEGINSVLEGTPFKVAYRVRDEFLIYVFNNSQLKDRPVDWLDQCLDELVPMKVLSRIEGDEGKVGNVLKGLITQLPQEWTRSHRKLAEMRTRLEVSGYTSFWS